MRISPDIADILKHYVYVYSDPRNGKPFYVGKGQNNRIFEHLEDISDTEKTIAIRKIRSSGVEPKIDVLRYGLTDREARLVEAAVIDFAGLRNLSNRVAGHHESFSRVEVSELIETLSAKPVNVRHSAIFITINKLYRSDMTANELYEATRGIWIVGAKRTKAKYGIAVYHGTVKEVYQIQQWHPAGTLAYQTRDSSGFKDSGRWEFEGTVAMGLREEYIGFSVGTGGQNPIRYKL